MVQKVFRRVEKKYLINEKQYQDILSLASSYIVKDRFYKTTICNIYFDNYNNDLIINSLEKPIYKEKIRLRSYGTPSLNDKVFFEIKKKYSGTVFKRREIVTLKEAYDYLDHHRYKQSQIMKEIDYCFNRYNLEPSLYLAYDRYSYREKNNSHFRLTFDYNIRSRISDLKLDSGDEGQKLLNNNQYIMEVKCLNAMPLWFSKILSYLQIYPISFSKYGKIYEQRVLEECL